ncbi:MAG: hypothetical protein D6734_04175 [Candidatus Schekmanbacteria bacterium]|nr:MAG: hypothetical protein D6734_04175 [Candidatus Schekmanbacteria bacterium]
MNLSYNMNKIIDIPYFRLNDHSAFDKSSKTSFGWALKTTLNKKQAGKAILLSIFLTIIFPPLFPITILATLISLVRLFMDE